MVLHIFEKIIGRSGDPNEFLYRDPRKLQLMEQGFSPEEAEHMTWFYFRQTYGKIGGFLGGLSIVYFLDPYFNRLGRAIPRLRYQRSFMTLLKCGVVFLSLQAGDYLSTAKREGANFWVANFFNNNNYIRCKESFLRNFEVLNRRFSDDEIEKFEIHKNFNSDFQRRFIYNPHVHGEDEAAFWERVKLLKSPEALYKNKGVSEKIMLENADKVSQGEKIVFKPYDITEDVDRSGNKNLLDMNPLKFHYKALN